MTIADIMRLASLQTEGQACESEVIKHPVTQFLTLNEELSTAPLYATLRLCAFCVKKRPSAGLFSLFVLAGSALRLLRLAKHLTSKRLQYEP